MSLLKKGKIIVLLAATATLVVSLVNDKKSVEEKK